MSLKGTVWAPIGPSPISEGSTRDNGLTTAIAINPNNANVIYQGTAGGGVWRTIDGGLTWTPLFDRQIALGIGEPGALAIDPNNTDIIYVGTSQRVTPQTQAGLFKSTDGGASCIQLGSGFPVGNTGNASQFVFQWINVTIVDPADSQTLYLSSTSGLFRSVDGGQNWTVGTNGGGDARSLVLDTSSPTSSRILYAGISFRGVFQSTDGGQSWTQILNGNTPAVASAVGPAPAGFGKVVVAIAPPTSPPGPSGVRVLYVSLEGTGGAADPVGLFLSTDQGATWTQQSATGMPTRTQGGYSFHMAVDPASPGDGINDIIYFGAVGQARSTNSGGSFTGLTGMHADTHAWAFFPQPSPTPSIVLCGNDGGIFKSVDGGATWTSLNGGGLQTSLFYNLDIKPDTTASVTVGALQDNEVETTKGGTGLGWLGTNGGDGWDVAYDATIPGQLYSSSGFWSPAPCTRVFRSTDDGDTWAEITPWGTTSDGGCYLAPVTTDPSTGGIVYVSGSQNLWQSRDGGATWRILAPFAGAGNVEAARANGNNVVIAVGNQVFVSTNALAPTVGLPSGVIFTNITRNLPGRNVLRALFDPNDPTVIYAVHGGFNGGPGQTGHVFRTTVGAASWTDISPALDVPFGAIALDGMDTPTTIYAGTDLGVLRSVDGGSSWSVLDDIHFPRAPVTDLVLNQQAGVLRAATYGRGVFQFSQPTGPAIAVNLQDGLAFDTVCTGPVYLTLQIFNVGVKDLIVNSVQRLMGSSGFVVLSTPGTPMVINAGEEVDFTVQYNPTTTGTQETATIRISSNDPASPFVDLAATGSGGTASLEVIIAGNGDLGNVCPGSFAETVLNINNRGPCPLSIFNISSSSPEFTVPSVIFYPLIVGAGGSIDVPIRFQPTSFGPKSALLTVASDDPNSPLTVALSGFAPSGKLAVTGSASFGRVKVGRRAQRTVSVCNVGECDLHVTGVSFEHKHKHKCSHFRLLHNPFPATIRPGSFLTLVIQYKATCERRMECDLVITSDDPSTPISTLEVKAYTRRSLFASLRCWLARELRSILEAEEDEDEDM